MLEPPDIPDDRIAACLWDAYDLRAAEIAFLPIGADRDTAAYRVTAADGAPPYFLKLRRGAFDALAVDLPGFLADKGIGAIIAPLVTNAGRLYAPLDRFSAILYPYVEGRNGFEVVLSPAQWTAFGAALARLHAIALPPALAARLPRETYSLRWRESLRQWLASTEDGVWPDAVAAELVTFLRARHGEVLDLVERAEGYARALQARPPALVVCHSDVHAGNILVGSDDRLYIVDWDEPILAPKERDLMYVGGAQGFRGYAADEEEALFYRGYGPAEVDVTALAHYRYERIVVDLAIYCRQLLATDEGGADRRQSLHYLMSNWEPGGTIAMARRAEGALRDGGAAGGEGPTTGA